MRAKRIVVAVVLCAMLTGCQPLQDFLDPPPEGGHTRVAKKYAEFPPLPREQRKIVTVYKFENRAKYVHGMALSDGLRHQLESALMHTKQFRVLNRAQLDDLMREKRLQRSGEATGTAGKTKLIGAAYLISGAVTELDDKDAFGIGVAKSLRLGFTRKTGIVGLDLTITDAGTGEMLASIPVRKTVTTTGLTAGHQWGVAGGVKISNALDQAARAALEEAVYRILLEEGVRK